MPKKVALPAPEAPAPNRRDSESIVQAILDAAISLPGDTTMAALAERAGVGPASLYRYFPNLGAVYAELARFTQRQFLDMVKVLTSQPDLPTEQGIEMLCRLAVAVPRGLRRRVDLDVPFAWSEEHAVPIFEEAIDVITAWLASRLPSPPADLRERVFLMFAFNRGVVIFSAMMPANAPGDEVAVGHMVDLARRLLGLGPRGPG